MVLLKGGYVSGLRALSLYYTQHAHKSHPKRLLTGLELVIRKRRVPVNE